MRGRNTEETFTLTITRRQRTLLQRLLEVQRRVSKEHYQEFLDAYLSERDAMRISGLQEIEVLINRLGG